MKGNLKLLVLICIGVLSFLLLVGVVLIGNGKQNEAVKPDTQMSESVTQESESEENYETEQKDIELVDTEETDIEDDFLAGMTLKEKVCQMFILMPEQLQEGGKVTAADESTKAALENYPIGGILYMQSNLIGIDQTKTMIANVQSYSREITGLPMFICVDEEGGRVARIANNPAFEVANVGAMADIKDSGSAYQAGSAMGEYLQELGFNWDFAPVADVITNGENKVIGNRSFGIDSSQVKEYAISVSDGLHSHGIMTTFKHFPGHGATEGDTHEGFAYTNKTYEELLQNELVPFASAQSAGVDAIMIAHISLPNVIGDNTPCTLSYRVVTEILRNDLGYEGLIVTDAMNMGAITNVYSSGEATVQAIQAGCDIILGPDDFRESVEAVIEAVENGVIEEKRIDASVRRILQAKRKLM